MLLLIENSSLIEWGGLLIIIAFVFAETGLLLGIIVPGGETLLFTAGLLVSTRTLQTDISTLLIGIILAAIAGDISGFYIGRKFKKRLHQKEDTWYFKKKYLKLAEPSRIAGAADKGLSGLYTAGKYFSSVGAGDKGI